MIGMQIRMARSMMGCAAACVLLAGPISAPKFAVAGAQANTGCECPRVLDSSGQPLKVPPGKQPVLLVHGFGLPGTPFPFGHWSEWDRDGGLAKQLETGPNKENFVVGRLDYSDVHSNWVTDRPNGEASIAEMVAAATKCMAVNTKKKVILGGHSMGGLAIQAALQDKGAADNTAGVISVGTPWKGLDLKAIEYMMAIGKLAAKKAPSDNVLPVSTYIDSIGSSSAFQALKTGPDGKPSAQVGQLHYIPAGIPVLPVAGNVTAWSNTEAQKQTVPTREPEAPAIPVADRTTGQRVNLIGTTVAVFDQKRPAIAAAPENVSETRDPLVGIKSARSPNADNVLPAKTLECVGIQCGLYHSDLPSTPAFADAVMPTIKLWRSSNTLVDYSRLGESDTSFGSCSAPTPVPVATPKRPITQPKVAAPKPPVEKQTPIKTKKESSSSKRDESPRHEEETSKKRDEPYTCGGTEGENDEPCPARGEHDSKKKTKEDLSPSDRERCEDGKLGNSGIDGCTSNR